MLSRTTSSLRRGSTGGVLAPAALETELAAYPELSSLMTLDPVLAMQRFLDLAIDLCPAGGSAGLSELTEDEQGESVFKWTMMSGAFAIRRGHRPGDTPGTITVQFKCDGGACSPIIADDGSGFEASPREGSPGMRLITSLARQFDATLHIDRASGTTVRLEWSVAREDVGCCLEPLTA